MNTPSILYILISLVILGGSVLAVVFWRELLFIVVNFKQYVRESTERAKNTNSKLEEINNNIDTKVKDAVNEALKERGY